MRKAWSRLGKGDGDGRIGRRQHWAGEEMKGLFGKLLWLVPVALVIGFVLSRSVSTDAPVHAGLCRSLGDGLEIETDLRVTSSPEEGFVLSGSDTVSGPADNRALIDVVRGLSDPDCLGPFIFRANASVADGKILLTDRWNVRPGGEGAIWSIWTEHRTAHVRGYIRGVDRFTSVPWTLHVELVGTQWEGMPGGGRIPTTKDAHSADWQFDAVPEGMNFAVQLPRPASMRAWIDTNLGGRLRLITALLSSVGAILAWRYAHRVGDRRIKQASNLLLVLLVEILAIQAFIINGVTIVPIQETAWFLLTLGLPLTFFVGTASIFNRPSWKSVIGTCLLTVGLAMVAWAPFLPSNSPLANRVRAISAWSLILVVLSTVISTFAVWARACLPSPRRALGGGVAAVVFLASGVTVAVAAFGLGSEWVQAEDLSQASTYASPLKLMTGFLAAFHPISVFTWPTVLSLLGLLLFLLALRHHSVDNADELPDTFDRYWGAMGMFGLGVVGVGGFLLGLSFPMALMGFGFFAWAMRRRMRTSELASELGRQHLSLRDLFENRAELALRGLEVERLQSERRERLRDLGLNLFGPARFQEKVEELKARIQLVGRKGVGVPSPGIPLRDPNGAFRLIFQGGPTMHWLTTGWMAIGIGGWLALVPVGYFCWRLILELPSRLGGSSFATPGVLVLVMTEVAFWLTAAFVLGAIGSYLPGDHHLSKALVLASLFAAATGLAALAGEWLGLAGATGWILRVSTLALFLSAVGFILDAKTLSAHGLSWREAIDLYRLGRVDSLVRYAAPVLLALIAVIQQLLTGAGADVVKSVLENSTNLLPS